MRIHNTYTREEFKALSSDQLEKMLHDELDKEQKDDALILMLLDVLENREPMVPSVAPEEAWQTFVERYNTPIAPELVIRRKSTIRWIGSVAAVIALFLVAFLGVPKAAGHNNVIQLIASWTDDFFYLSSSENPLLQNEYVFKTNNPGLQRVYDAVVEMGITDPVVPMWIPKEYELVEIKKATIENGNKLFVAFENGTSRITIYYKISCDPRESNYPKDITDVEIVEFNGTVVSVLNNDSYTTSIWQTNNIECMITTTEDSATTIRIIKSIFYGESL